MALFANQRSAPAASQYLTEFKAGKCRFTTKPDAPDAMEIAAVEGPGLIYLHQTDDMLTRFCYKNLTTNQVEDELIVFPGDAIFFAVDDVPDARVYLFKFKNSATDRWHFYWMQESDASQDEERGKRLNQLMNGENRPTTQASLAAAGGRGGGGLSNNMGVEALQQMLGLPPGDTAQLFQSIPPAQLQQLLGGQLGNLGGVDPTALLSGLGATPRAGAPNADASMVTPAGQIAATPSVVPAAPTRAGGRRHGGHPPTAAPAGGIQLSQLQSALSGVTNTPAAGAAPTAVHLSDLFPSGSSGAEARKLVSRSAATHASKLQPLLPSQPPIVEQSTDELRHTLASPQFQQAVQTLDAAMRSGQGGMILRQFGVPEAAARAADGADVAALADTLESAAIKPTDGEEKKNVEAEDAETSAGAPAKEPAAKRNKQDKRDGDDDSEEAKTVGDGMDLD